MVTEPPDIESTEQDDQQPSPMEMIISDLIHQQFSKGTPGDYDISMSTNCLYQHLQSIWPALYSPDQVGKVLYDQNFQVKVFPDSGPEWLLISK